MKKLIIVLILLLTSTIVVAADEPTAVEIHDIADTQTLKFKDNIYSVFKVMDDSDRITEINIMLSSANINYDTGVTINLSNNFSYTVVERRFNYLYFIPYREIRHHVLYQNKTILMGNETYLNILPVNININIKYDINNGNTSFLVMPSANYFNNLQFESDKFVGIPANQVTINALSKFDVDITIMDIGNRLNVAEQKRELSGLSKNIYKLLTLGGWIGESTILLSTLRLLDLFFNFMILLYNVIFVFPILLMFWIITVGNFYVSWKSNTPKDFLTWYFAYYKGVGRSVINILHDAYRLIIRIIQAIGSLIPFT